MNQRWMYGLVLLLQCAVFPFFGQTLRAGECPEAMAAYWHLDESAAPYQDQLASSQLSCAGSCPTPVSGAIGRAQLFNGSSSGLTIAAAPRFDWPAGGSFTLEFRMKRAVGLTGPEVLLSREDAAQVSLLQWWVGLNSAGKVEVSLLDRNGNGPAATLVGTTPVVDGKWHHVAVVRDGASSKTSLYVDGLPAGVQSYTYAAGFRAAAPITVGWLQTGGYRYAGALDELAITNRALTALEIRQHHTDGTVGLGLGYCYDGQPVRIMPLGDSITQGTSTFTTNQDYYVGYRQNLFRTLESEGYAVDFVGGGESAGTLALPPFDTDHEGHPLWTDTQVANNVYSWLAAHPADVVLLHIGTNSVGPDPGDVERLLDQIDNYSKDIVVLVARIVNRGSGSAVTTTFNNNVEAMARQRIAAGDKIILVDQENALIYPQDIADDNLHPTEMGYKKMAATWFAALQSVLPTANALPALKFSDDWLHFDTTQGATPASQSLGLATRDGAATGFSLTSSAPWLHINPASGAATPAALTLSVNTAGLNAGIYTAWVTASAPGFVDAAAKVTLAVQTVGSGYELKVSSAPDRSNAGLLEDAELSGRIHVFLEGSAQNVRRVFFSLDGTPAWTEVGAPFDFAGTAPDGTAKVFDTNRLEDGMHVISAQVQYYGGATKTASASFTVSNSLRSLKTSLASLQFAAGQNGNPPASQSVTVSTSDGQVAGFTASSNASWLRVAPSSGTTPGTLVLTISDTALSPGVYEGTVSISGSGYVAAVLKVHYTVTSGAGTALVASPGSLTFQAEGGGGQPASQAVAVAAADGSAAQFTASSNVDWLTLSPSSGITPASLTLSVNTTDLAAGTYTATVVVSAGGYDTITVPVTYNVSGAQSSLYNLFVSTSADRSSPTTLEASVVSGELYIYLAGPTANVRQVIFSLDGTAMKTEGAAPYDFAGTAVNGDANAYSTAQLADGEHVMTAVVMFYGGATATASARFTVSNHSAILTLKPAALEFTAQQGEALPGPQTVMMSTSDGQIAYFTASSDAGWLTVSPSSGSTPASLSVTVNETSLAPGVYSGEVILSSSGYGNAAIPVRYTVSPPPAPASLTVAPAALQFAASQNGILPAAQQLGVAASDDGGAYFSASSDAQWLTLSAASGTTPDSLAVSVNDVSLAPGTYTGTILLSAAGYMPATVTVTYTVASLVPSAYSILLSSSADRTAATGLNGASVSGNMYVYSTGPTKNLRQVIFSLDGTAVKTEGAAPYDFAGTAINGAANPYDTRQLADGVHRIDALIMFYGGATSQASAIFTVNNAAH